MFKTKKGIIITVCCVVLALAVIGAVIFFIVTANSKKSFVNKTVTRDNEQLYTFVEFETNLSSTNCLESVWVKVSAISGEYTLHMSTYDSENTTGSSGSSSLALDSNGKKTFKEGETEYGKWLAFAIVQNNTTSSSVGNTIATKKYFVLDILGNVTIDEIVLVTSTEENGVKEYHKATATVLKAGYVESNALTSTFDSGNRQIDMKIAENAKALVDDQDSFDLNKIVRKDVKEFLYE